MYHQNKSPAVHMTKTNLRWLLISQSLFSFSLNSQNILFHSSDARSIEAPQKIVEASTKLRDLLKDKSSSMAVINVPSKGILIERLIAFSSSEIFSGNDSKNTCAELVSYLSTFCKINLPRSFSKSSLVSDRTTREFAQTTFATLQRDLFPTLSYELISHTLIGELSEQICLAEFMGNQQLKHRLSCALAGALSYLTASPTIFLLPLLKDSRLSKDTKIIIVQKIGSLIHSTTTIQSFLQLIVDNNVSSSTIKKVINTFDAATLHHLLYILETYFEPHAIQLLRKQDFVSRDMNRKRLKEITDLEDSNVSKVRTLLIANLAKSVLPKATNIPFENLAVFSSLPTNTIAEVMHLVIEKYPGLLLEFADINSINIHRELENKPLLEVLPEVRTSKPFRKILSSLEQKFPYFSADQLYDALKISFETSYKIE